MSLRSKAFRLVVLLGVSACAAHQDKNEIAPAVAPATFEAIPSAGGERPPLRSGPRRALSIAAGANHACARMNDDGVVCWGADASGQSGDASLLSHVDPARVADVEGAQEIALGSEHSCARLADGTVRCWGANDMGQLGDGTTTLSASPREVVGVKDAVRIAAGVGHTCVVTRTGAVACWGSDGVRAKGERAAAETPARATVVPGVEHAIDLALGSGLTCARLAGGELTCWGERSAGLDALGHGSAVLAIAAFGERACAIRADGVACFDAITRALDRVDVAAALHAQPVEIGLGFEMGCARSSAGAVACWGKNDWGQLGDGTTRSRAEAAIVPGLDPADALAVGSGHVCARFARDGEIGCWGSNASGQLGVDPRLESDAPRPVASLGPVRAVSLGQSRSCAITDSGGVVCWGATMALGVPSPTHAETQPSPLEDASAATALALGGVADQGFLCLTTDSGAARCLGANDRGQLGDGTRDSRADLADAEHVPRVVEIATGQRHACARTVGGEILCWGDDGRGELGDGGPSSRHHSHRSRASARRSALPTPAPPSRDVPHLVRGISGASSIAAGLDFSCARLRDGTARCWGDNASGQLGDGSVRVHPTPARVRNLSGIVALTVGDAHACALTKGGSVRCWGDDRFGQLGDGGADMRKLVPTPIGDLTHVKQIAAGGLATCALLDDGTVRCWGSRPSAGDPSTLVAQRTPTPIRGLDGVTSIAVAADHACALVADRTARCWGNNESGQLGDGHRFLWSATPAAVVLP